MKPGTIIMGGLQFIEELPFEQLYSKYSQHHRLQTFAQKGLKCVCCDRTGSRLVKARDSGGGIHIDVYTKDWHMMTVDHIIPKSKGGKNHIDNFQPMCKKHNEQKGNKYEKEGCHHNR